jgi:hypothetical protein
MQQPKPKYKMTTIIYKTIHRKLKIELRKSFLYTCDSSIALATERMMPSGTNRPIAEKGLKIPKG